MLKVCVVNHLRMRIVHNLVKLPPPLIALYLPLNHYTIIVMIIHLIYTAGEMANGDGRQKHG